MKKVLIGTVTIDKDLIVDQSFQYAASFEAVKAPAGTYNIVAYEGDLDRINGNLALGWRNYIEWEGTVVRSNVGSKPGDHAQCGEHIYDYQLAECFVDGKRRSPRDNYNALAQYVLRPEWEIKVRECQSPLDGRRLFSLDVVLKEGEKLVYAE